MWFVDDVVSRSALVRAQLELMEAVNAPLAAWDGFAREVSALLRELESALSAADTPVLHDQLRHAIADARAVLAVVSDKIAS
jgi:hypothetical protein